MNHITFVFKEGEEHFAAIGHLLKKYVYTATCDGNLKLATKDSPILDDIPFFPLFGWFEGMDATTVNMNGKVRFYLSSNTEKVKTARKMLTVIFPDLSKLKSNNDFDVVDMVEGYNVKKLSTDLLDKLRSDNIKMIDTNGGSWNYMENHAKKVYDLKKERGESLNKGFAYFYLQSTHCRA